MNSIKYGSVCSGVEAASLAWEPLGWKCNFVSEIEKFPSAVLKHHWPTVPNLGDMTEDDFIDRAAATGPIDVLIGGTPCQSFSVAGLRKGLDDDRGNLALRFCQIAQALQPTVVLWENVPGVLSSNGGRDFGAIIGGLAECGYGISYRVLDAQHFGVPQRRRRVFLVGYIGDWRRAAAILFEQACLQGDITPRREEREDIAPTVSAGAPFSRTGSERVEAQELVPLCQDITGALMARDYKGPAGDSLDPAKLIPVYQSNQHHNPQDVNVVNLTTSNCAGIKGDSIMCINARETPVSTRGKDLPLGALSAQFYGSSDKAPHIAVQMQVRRLTTTECLRLQGMPDGHTKIPWRGKPAEECPDGPQYKAIGNSMAVPVIKWLGQRIQTVLEMT